jgi:SdrD B-like domain
MKSALDLAPRLALVLCGLGGIAWWRAAHAQELPALAIPSAGFASQPASVYQDRYINGGALTPDISTGQDGLPDGEGLTRTLEIDGVLSVLSSHDAGAPANVLESGIVARSQWDTISYGAWSLDGSARTGGTKLGSSQGQGGTITLRQRGMPFDGGWQADSGLGDLNSPNITLARLQPRFYLPTSPMQGITTELHGPASIQIVGGVGVPGYFNGIEVPDFRRLNGSTATAGAEWSPAPHWAVGGQVAEAHDVDVYQSPLGYGVAPLSSTTGILAASWQDHGERAQLNLIDGSTSGHSNAVGGWLDAASAHGRFMQTAGLFRIGPDLAWDGQPIANDVQGAYYRLGYHSRQWLADIGIDEVHSVSALGSHSTFLTGDTRYQLSRDWGIGAVANLRRGDGALSWSLENYVDHLNRWGTGRAQIDFAKTPGGQDAMLTVDEAWSTPVGIRLSTSTSIERIRGDVLYGLPQNSTALSINVYGGGQFTTRLGIDGNVRWSTALQGRSAPGVSANISLIWQLSSAWSILGSFYDSQIGSWTPITVSSPLTPPVTTIPAVQERGLFLTFRYQRAAGSRFVPLGGLPGAGSGDLTGIVYLDANDNGRLDAGEVGAPNVMVVLDGRFSVQTDASGRYRFGGVAAGHHSLAVSPDNLPLPWMLTGEGRTDVAVETRSRTEVDFAAQRPR